MSQAHNPSGPEDRRPGVVDLEADDDFDPESIYREFEQGSDDDEAAAGDGLPADPAVADAAGAAADGADDALRDRYLRALADLENLRKRQQRQVLEFRRYGHEHAVKEILPVLDNLQRAIEAASRSEDAGVVSFRQGVAMIAQQFVTALGRLGVSEVSAEGEPFDPQVHEALQEAPHDGVPPNTVLHVLERGYQLHDRLLRPARVVVSRPGDGAENPAPADAAGESAPPPAESGSEADDAGES